MPILSIPLGIKLHKSNDKNLLPSGNLLDIREKLPPGWRPPKTSKRKSRPKSTRSKNIKNFLGGTKINSPGEVLAKLLQPIIRGFLARKKYKPLLDTIVIFPLKKKNKRLQRLRILAELA